MGGLRNIGGINLLGKALISSANGEEITRPQGQTRINMFSASRAVRQYEQSEA